MEGRREGVCSMDERNCLNTRFASPSPSSSLHTAHTHDAVYNRITRKFRGVNFSRKLIRLSFRDYIFTDSDPIAIINDVNIVSRIKIFAGGDKSVKTAKILTCNHKTF